MLRSVLEGVGYNLRVILELLEQIQPVKTITMIGGGVKSMVWRQILSDIYGKNLNFHNIWRKLHLWGLQSVRVLV